MLKFFKIIGYLEAVSAIVLFFIAMPLKYIFNDPSWIPYAGRIHGGLFVLYVIILYLVKEKYNWSMTIFLIFFFAGVIPGGTIWAEKKFIEGKKYKKILAEQELK